MTSAVAVGMLESLASDPAKDHLDWYKGLMLSCKTIYGEIEHEVVKNTNKHLIKRKETWDKDLSVSNAGWYKRVRICSLSASDVVRSI